MSQTPNTPADVQQAILDAATSPVQVTTDAGTVRARDIDEMRRAEQHVRAANASLTPPFGLKIARIRFGST